MVSFLRIPASTSLGNSLYGIDIKEIDGSYLVIEVNDNPNIDAGSEDQNNPEVYRNVIRHLAGEPWESWIAVK